MFNNVFAKENDDGTVGFLFFFTFSSSPLSSYLSINSCFDRKLISNDCCLFVQSIIMPVYNASCWLDECLQAIIQQDFSGTMQLSVFDDASTVSVFLHLQKRGRNSPKLKSNVCPPFRMAPGQQWKDGGKGWRREAYQ